MEETTAHDKAILIADNSMLNRMQIGGVLSSEYEIVEAEDGEAALRVMREQGADKLAAVLLDLHMPGISGFDVLAEKQADPTIADIPVIIITADSVTASEVQAFDLGAEDFLSKPIEPEIMRRRIRSVVTVRLLEEQRAHNRLLEEKAWISDHDELTGLYTRNAFIREMKHMFDENPDSTFMLAVWDFDKFKMLNELLGMNAGDRILKAAAETMKELFANTGVYGRLGNDDFAFCVAEDEADVEQIMDRIFADIDGMFKEKGVNHVPSLATGVYRVDGDDIKANVMLDRATMAQHTVKGNYDCHLAYYDSKLSERMLAEQDILNCMEEALANGEFHVQLQPIYDVATGKPASAEALVRWHRPGHGIVSPGVFIPLFEQSGFISKMDFCVWESVCKILADRRDRGLPQIPISVNLSRRSIYNSDLFDVIVGLVERYELDPKLLRIEVTESSYIDDAGLVISLVGRLREYGFTILMDDFGSGYSSFNALKDIPVDILKMDMIFMRNFERNGRVASIFKSIVRMARWLGMLVVAEGVETADQFDFLRSIGCRYAQGFYLARPMSPEDFEEHLVEHPLTSIDDVTKLSKDEVNRILGGSRIFDKILDDMTCGFAVCEWDEGSPEALRTSREFARSIRIKKETYAKGGVRLLDYIAPDDRQAFLDACVEALEGEYSVTMNVDIVGEDGATRRYAITILRIGAREINSIFFVFLRERYPES